MTLWYLIWQRLSPQHTLAAAVADARRGGPDALRPGPEPLSARLRSIAMTALAKARQRLPLAWVSDQFERLAQGLAALAGQGHPETLPVRVLDGSTLRLRPHGDIPQQFPPHRTRHRKKHWCVARLVVGFCADSAVALAAQMGSENTSEQALAGRLIRAAAAGAISRAASVPDLAQQLSPGAPTTPETGPEKLVALDWQSALRSGRQPCRPQSGSLDLLNRRDAKGAEKSESRSQLPKSKRWRGFGGASTTRSVWSAPACWRFGRGGPVARRHGLVARAT